MDDIKLCRCRVFQYLSSIIQDDEELIEDLINRINIC